MGSVKLLDKTFGVYLFSSIAVLVVAAPIFYFTMKQLYMEDADETLDLYKKEFKYYDLPVLKQSDIESYNRFNRDMRIEPFNGYVVSDTIYYKNYLDTLSNENEPYRVLQSSIVIENKPYLFTARISLVENEDLMKSIAFVFVVLIALLLIILLVITRLYSKRIWQPFQNTLAKIKTFDLSQGNKISFEKVNIKEFNELNLSLQKLTDQNLSVYSQQKAFIENASHELQTPLAVLKIKLNLLLQNKNITSEQAALLSAIDLPLARMTRINKNLLLLAKIENKQFAEAENLNLNEVINETLELLTDYIASKNITVDKNLSENIYISCNKTLLEILINNLLINANVHNIEQGNIQISLTGKTLVVSNTGKTALDKEKLFKRFTVSSSQTVNSGLGLAIVKEICNRYQWKIEYNFENEIHTFKVTF